jgi:subtilisin family serine protease
MLKMSLFVLVLALGFGCQPDQKFSEQRLVQAPFSDEIKELVSNRPSKPADKKVVMLKLSEPALFTTATKVEKNITIDEDLKKRILAEQEKVTGKIKEVSPDAKILFKYRFVLNALAVVLSHQDIEKIKGLENVLVVSAESYFDRPITHDISSKEENRDLNAKNSVTFIGADKVHQLTTTNAQGQNVQVTGIGMRVGVIDSGIDYTHTMLGGVGDKDVFKNLDGSKASEHFPNKKVVGGVDLVGKAYDASSSIWEKRIPQPDVNPIDEGGHGTHVAGSIAGIGDNVNTYSGVAPEAKLYAIKVFGENGSTSDSVIIAGLEYAADPNGDLDPSDKLDVVNLSLGSSYGKPRILYAEAVKNLVQGDVVMVASAGNSGHNDYITGSPGTSTEALSVAAGIDYMDHNWKFDTVSFELGDETIYAESIEASFTKPIADTEELKGKLVYIGDAADPLSDEIKAKLKGNIALIDRGKVSFISKFEKAVDAGAIAAIVVNNQDGAPFGMGGDGEIAIPGIMITLEMGNKIKAKLTDSEVISDFHSDTKIEKPELIDTLTDFSSKGPRTEDSLLKPEITAPGFQIISAKMGGGDEGTQKSGTSMSGPHIAGVMALMKQYHPKLSVVDLKSLVMGTAKSISDDKGEIYPLSQQGAGRVQTFEAIKSKIVFEKVSLSLGEHQLSGSKKIVKRITVKNITDKKLSVIVDGDLSEYLSVKTPGEVELLPMTDTEVVLVFTLKAPKKDDKRIEADGFVNMKTGEQVIAKIPVLAILTKLSALKVEKFQVAASSIDEAEGALVSLKLKNKANLPGRAMPFNLIGKDQRKAIDLSRIRSSRVDTCDLESAGYRLIEKNDKTILQVAVKLFRPLSHWNECEVSVLFDNDGDNVFDQELGGTMTDKLPGLDKVPGLDPQGFYSILLDTKKTRELRVKFEQDQRSSDTPSKVEADYREAIQDLQEFTVFNHASLSILQVDLSAVVKTKEGAVKFKVAVLNEDRSGSEADDYLGKKWLNISPFVIDHGYVNIPETIEVPAKSKKTVHFTKGGRDQKLIIYAPENKGHKGILGNDKQQMIPNLKFSL